MSNVGVKRDSWLIYDIDLHINYGDVIAIIGANGSGKSTLIKTLLGLIVPTQGTVTKHPAARLGYVPQRFVLPKTLPLTVSDLLAQSTGATTLMQQKIDTLLNINPLLTKQVGTLSGGETQRVLLAKALLDNPTVLVLDEPVQGLDSDAEQMLYELLNALPTLLNCAVVVVSHDLHWVMQATKHVICLNKHIQCQGTPQQVSVSPQFLASFGRFIPSPTPAQDHYGLA